MLLGRESEQQALGRVLAESRSGQSHVLALVGEPGIGKTALLDALAAEAGSMRVLRARGVESEAEVPFAALLELLRPALGSLSRIPAPQAEALGGALALRPGQAGDRFAVGAGTLSLLAAEAEAGPLLVLVDDVHWLDTSSAEALRFAVRRLLADPIAVVLAARAGEPSLLDGSDIPVLELGGLDRAAAEALLAAGHGPAPAGDAAAWLHEATAGNPLALIELAARGLELVTLPPTRPAPLPERLADAFGHRANELPPATRRALVLTAVAGGGDVAVLARSGASLGVDVADLGPAESAGLVRLVGGAVEFRHPLVRSAVYDRADPGERRAAHRALANALPDRDADRRAWHLAGAALGPDDRAAAALAAAAGRAEGRSAYRVAAAAYERAARLTADDAHRARRLQRAAEAAWLAGATVEVERLAGEVEGLTADPAVLVRAEHLRGHVVARRGALAEGEAILVAGAERAVAAGERELAVVMLAEAVSAAFYAGDGPAMLAAAERAMEALEDEPSERADFLAHTAFGVALMWSQRVDEATSALRRSVALLEGSPALRADPRLHSWALIPPLFLRDSASGRALADEILRAARERSAVGVLSTLLHYVARDHATSDRWDRAQVGYDEAARLAREIGQTADLCAALSGLAWLEARQGREEACRAHAAEALALLRPLGGRTHEIWALAALAELELAQGRTAAAAERLGEWRDRLAELDFDDPDLSPGPELVEVHLRLGDEGAAAAALAAFAGQAERKGRPWALARAARCRGLLGSDTELDDHFAAALRWHALTPDGFETARTRLAYGARLRRARRRADAREQLRAALSAFERLGAAPWADQAGAELAATGERARRRDPSTLDDLTPQELQIAHLLAEGRTTREAAAALFLSPKTIEYHLRNVYRKLGIRSRAELTAKLDSGDAEPALSGAR